MDFVHPLVVDKVDSSEVIVNEGAHRASLETVGKTPDTLNSPTSLCDSGDCIL